LLVVVVFAFSVPGARNGSGALWTAFVFAGMLGVMQSLAVETRNRALDGLVLAPIPPAAIYVGKVVSNAVFATLVGLTTLGAVGVFLHAPLPTTVLAAVAVIVLFAVGFAAVSVVVGIITTVTGISQLLLPVLLLPLLLPALLAGVAQFETGHVLWFGVLAGYDGVVFVAGALVFGELVG
jgi:heme exporter protein B